ncbi:MAG: hypothetical protein L3K14_06400 [Thermoplasmata archaeon]|nr:hypothetical protein [Thermoplasmata archaeon]
MTQRLRVVSEENEIVQGRLLDSPSEEVFFGVRQDDLVEVPISALRSRCRKADIRRYPNCRKPLNRI